MKVFVRPRTAIAPATLWSVILPRNGRRLNRKLLRHELRTSEWPPLTLFGAFPSDVATVGGTAQFLAERAPHSKRQRNLGGERRSSVSSRV